MADTSTASPPPRRFLPQPEETTTTHRRRRFVPEPVESSSRSSRSKPIGVNVGASHETSKRKILPEPVETSSKTRRSGKSARDSEQTEGQKDTPRRRFLPEPVETLTRSNRRSSSADGHDDTQRIRRFKIDPIETTKSHRGPRDRDEEEDPSSTSTKAPKRFKPEPIETSTGSSRKAKADVVKDQSSNYRSHGLPDPIEASTKSNRRKKFTPQLIETVSRSRRVGDSNPPEKNQISPTDERHHRPPRPTLNPLQTSFPSSPFDTADDGPYIEESRFSSASLSRKATRSHSFLVPSLPSIASNGEESDVPSLSTSDSADSEDYESYNHASRIRESCDERFSGYLLQLAARAAEKQLEDQALAAFPNETRHEPVNHFAIDDEDLSDDDSKVDIISRDTDLDIAVFRRQSAADLGFELQEMRRHQAKLSKEKQVQKEQDEMEWLRSTPTQAPQGPFQPTAQTVKHVAHANDASDGPKNIIGGWQKGVGLTQMRSAASPPMLGGDLVFARSMSPKATRLDVDQFPIPGKHAAEEITSPKEPGLWFRNDKAKQFDGAGGLWMGCCTKSNLQQHQDSTLLGPSRNLKSGIMTPFPERGDSMPDTDAPIAMMDMRQLPPSPPSSHPGSQLDGIDRTLHMERQIETEFDDVFVTQIYNYLSLGYPSLARKFDLEISKISRVPVSELRRDDQRTDAKGYVGTPEGDGIDEEGAANGKCPRWSALKLYVHEWARQQPGMADHNKMGMDSWTAGARRGSWAI